MQTLWQAARGFKRRTQVRMRPLRGSTTKNWRPGTERVTEALMKICQKPHPFLSCLIFSPNTAPHPFKSVLFGVLLPASKNIATDGPFSSCYFSCSVTPIIFGPCSSPSPIKKSHTTINKVGSARWWEWLAG